MKHWRYSVALAVFIATALAIFIATRSGGGRGQEADASRKLTGGRTFQTGLGGATALAGLEPVQRELALDPSVASKVNKVLDQLAEDSNLEWESSGLSDDHMQLRMLEGKEFAAKRREISEKTAAVSAKLEEKFRPRLKAALSSAQYQRFQQIIWQWDGSRSLVDDPELVAALKITTEQKKAISDLNQDIRERQAEIQRKVFEAGGANGPSREELQDLVAKMQEIDKARDKKAAGLLSDKQQDEYTKLKGATYDFSGWRPPG